MTFRHNHFTFFITPILLGVALLSANGCSNTTPATTNDGVVTTQSQLAASNVNQMVVKGAVPADLTFSAIVVTSAEVFVKDVKLHSDMDDSNHDDHDATIRTGPFVLLFDSTGTHVIGSATIPAGTYDRAKFEIHKPMENDSADAAILAKYPAFQNGNQTYTAVVSGYTISNGVRSYFTVHSSASRNVTVRFADNDSAFTSLQGVSLLSGSSIKLAFEFDPRIMFHLEGLLEGTLFDPTDTFHHQGDIDDHLMIAIRLVLAS